MEQNWSSYDKVMPVLPRLLQQAISEHRIILQAIELLPVDPQVSRGNVGGDGVPDWVVEIVKSNTDIYFTDRECRFNT